MPAVESVDIYDGWFARAAGRADGEGQGAGSRGPSKQQGSRAARFGVDARPMDGLNFTLRWVVGINWGKEWV